MTIVPILFIYLIIIINNTIYERSLVVDRTMTIVPIYSSEAFIGIIVYNEIKIKKVGHQVKSIVAMKQKFSILIFQITGSFFHSCFPVE